MKKIFWGLISFLSLLFCLNLNTNQVSAANKYALYTIDSTYYDGSTMSSAYAIDLSGDTTDTYSLHQLDIGYFYRNISGSNVNVGKCDFTYNLKEHSISVNSCSDYIMYDYGNANIINVHFDKSGVSSSNLSEVFEILNSINYSLIINKYSELYPAYSNLTHQQTNMPIFLSGDNGVFQITAPPHNPYSFSELKSAVFTLRYDSTLIDKAYQEGYNAGRDSIDVTSNDAEVRNEGYQLGYRDGQSSIDITSDNQEVYDKGFTDGQTSVDITSNDEEIWNEAYQDGKNDGYTLGFETGKDSVDLESIKQEEYNRGYNNGYNTGFAEGESSVDITSDNDTVIDAYITINKYHTDVEFNLNYEKGYNAGINFVYGNLGSDTVVNKYVTEYITEHKYHTDTEYIDNYEQGYDDGYDIGYNKGINDGKEVIYKNVASDPVVKEYWKTKLVNGTTINIINEGNEVVEVVKKYDVNYDSDDDLIINIHNGQDKYHVETVEEVIPGVSTTKEKIVFDYDLLKKAIIVVTASALGVIILVIIGSFLFTPRRKIKTHRKAGNGYVWSR